MPLEVHGLQSADIHAKVKKLIHELVNIKDTTGEFLLKLDDGRIIDTKGWNDWEWTHGIGLYGIWKYYELTGDEECLAIIEAWFRDRFAEGHKGKNINTMAVFLTLACVYEKTGNQTYLPWLDSWAEWAMHDLGRTRFGGMQHTTYLEANDEQLWDDTLMMTVMPLAKIGLVLNRPHYVAEAKRQFLLHIQYLSDPETGLFFHGWEFTDASGRAGGHNFARARWARGNAWLTIALPEFVELVGLAPDDPLRYHLLNVLEAQVRALVPLQAGSGLWRTLVDVPEEEGSYLESSATAGFAYGILKAQRKRYIGKEFEGTAAKAIQAVIDNVSPEGELLQTSFGTGMGRDLQHYKDIPRTSMPYGQAMAMMALVEFLRVYY
ncbi:glycosyl hydrolase [Sodiomyces alkalinus F11]|uniref:Glycosyl hydrolase n=1 Tax=Sodiomyces alkalinus (strain CBS 110278 / VKM F-3762 / F11) TaxID=1314773 RepID=A0A3N2Q2L7_SODAK|nr:glycosyl hydrolase [Sodiomyces alkalinus F11]ROT40972.1 glycosyl hydrolase [Sodiomyces alkalinus F11]